LCEPGHTGASGNVLINKKADRLSSYNIWDYAEGQDSYRKSMLVDLTQPPDKVSDRLYFRRLSGVVARFKPAPDRDHRRSIRTRAF